MREDTPLVEVVPHLPTSIALLVMDMSPAYQVSVLFAMRKAICEMEKRGVDLDPVNYEAVLHSMGILAMTVAEMGERLVRAQAEIESLKGGLG